MKNSELGGDLSNGIGYIESTDHETLCCIIVGGDTYDLPIFLYCYVTRKSEYLLEDKFSRTERWAEGECRGRTLEELKHVSVVSRVGS